MKKILIICDAFNERGGVEKIVALLANHYSVLNPVKVAVRFKLSEDHPYPLEKSVDVLSCGMHKRGPRNKIVKIFSFLSYMVWVRKIINQFQPDVVLCNGAGVATLTIISASEKYREKIIVCDHNKFENAAPLTYFLRGIAYRSAKHIISLTQEDLPKYKAIGQASCIYNPVIPPKRPVFSCLESKTVLAMGRLDAQKGFDLLIKAWAIVNAKHPDWTLKIVGDGREKNKLQELIAQSGLEQSVYMEPSTSNVFLKFTEASLFVLSSRYEGFCLVMIEAMSAGLPVVAFDCQTGPKEVLSTGGGFLVASEDYLGLAKMISHYIESPQIWKDLSLKSIETSKRFSLSRYLFEMDEIILK